MLPNERRYLSSECLRNSVHRRPKYYYRFSTLFHYHKSYCTFVRNAFKSGKTYRLHNISIHAFRRKPLCGVVKNVTKTNPPPRGSCVLAIARHAFVSRTTTIFSVFFFLSTYIILLNNRNYTRKTMFYTLFTLRQTRGEIWSKAIDYSPLTQSGFLQSPARSVDCQQTEHYKKKKEKKNEIP